MSDSTALHYPLTNAEWLKASQELKPAELIVLYHLRTLTPFGDRLLNLGVREIAKTLKMAPSTVSRALKRLDALGYVDLELINVNIRVLSKGVLSTDNSVAYRQQVLPTDNKCCLQTTPLIATQHPKSSETPQNKGSESFPQIPNKTDFKNFKKQEQPTTHPVCGKQERIGTAGEILEAIETAGIQPNPSIRRIIKQTIEQTGESAAVRRVENALAAVIEQIDKGSVPNPGGMLVTAIRKGFTPNQPPTVSPTSAPSESVDLSDVLAGIQIHCERLGWTKQEAIAHMVNHHGWKPVQWRQVTDDDLYILLDELRKLVLKDIPSDAT